MHDRFRYCRFNDADVTDRTTRMKSIMRWWCLMISWHPSSLLLTVIEQDGIVVEVLSRSNTAAIVVKNLGTFWLDSTPTCFESPSSVQCSRKVPWTTERHWTDRIPFSLGLIVYNTLESTGTEIDRDGRNSSENRIFCTPFRPNYWNLNRFSSGDSLNAPTERQVTCLIDACTRYTTGWCHQRGTEPPA